MLPFLAGLHSSPVHICSLSSHCQLTTHTVFQKSSKDSLLLRQPEIFLTWRPYLKIMLLVLITCNFLLFFFRILGIPPADAHALIVSRVLANRFKRRDRLEREGRVIEFHHNIMNNNNGIYLSRSWKLLIRPQKERNKFLPKGKIATSSYEGISGKYKVVPMLN
jgi:hypothetical protein